MGLCQPSTITEPVSVNVVDGVTAPASIAAAMVNGLKTEPGSYASKMAGLLNTLIEPASPYTFESKSGAPHIAKIFPVDGCTIITEPPSAPCFSTAALRLEHTLY